jgi:acetyl esterase/lipase
MTEERLVETITVRDMVYASPDGHDLRATLYRPAAAGTYPAIVALHGGGWRNASLTVYEHLGPWLAARGYVVLAPVYRVAAAGRKTFPEAVHDVRAAVQFAKGAARELSVDPDRVALMGESAGGHLAALTALAGDDPAIIGEAPTTEFSHVSAHVRAAIPVYGVYDLQAQWRRDLMSRPLDQQIVSLFLGASPIEDRRRAFEASPLSHVIPANNHTAFLVAWGTADDVVDHRTQADAFVDALKQAGFFVRTVVVANAPHYWLSEPLDVGGYPAFFAPRLLRFLRAKL